MLPENIIYVSLFTSSVGYFFYIKDIFYGQTKPNLVSWFIWMLASLLGFFFQVEAGAGLSALPVFLAGFGPFVVILISIFHKNSYWKINGLDLFCGALALTALIFYVVTHNLGISIIFAILSDGFASIPTLIKSWEFPETEHAAVYLPSIFNNTLALLIINNWIFSIYSFNLYFISMNIVILFCIYHKKIFKLNRV